MTTTEGCSLSRADAVAFAAALPGELSDWQLTMITNVMLGTSPRSAAGYACAGCFARFAMNILGGSGMTPRWEIVCPHTSGRRPSGASPSLVIIDEIC